MTESNAPLSGLFETALTELDSQFSNKILIQNPHLLHGTSVQSNQTYPYAVTDDVAVLLINKTLFCIRFYSEFSVRFCYNFWELTKNGLCLGTNRYAIYRKVLIIWLRAQQHIMRTHDFIYLVQHSLRLTSLELFTIPRLTTRLIWHWIFGPPEYSIESNECKHPNIGGGNIANNIPKSQLTDFLVQPAYLDGDNDTLYRLQCYVHRRELNDVMAENPGYIAVQIPIPLIGMCLTVQDLRNLGHIHGISYSGKLNKQDNLKRFEHHYCSNCEVYYSIFKLDDHYKVKKDKEKDRSAMGRSKHNQQKPNKVNNTWLNKTQIKKRKKQAKSLKKIQKPVTPTAFPPRPASDRLIHKVVSGFCQDTDPACFEEAGCAVCGQLTLLSNLKSIQDVDVSYDPLINPLAAKKEKKTLDDTDEQITTPLIDADCSHICVSCLGALEKGKRPLRSLANFLWIGKIPQALQGLTYAEQMLIARVRHNRCLVRVSSGRAKMIANAIMFTNPTVKVYKVLPPTREELSEVLAVVFIGSANPTPEDFKRTPMFVRRNKVADALEWLKLNHTDYASLNISKENLDTYEEEGIPVVVDYRKTDIENGNKIPSAMSKHDMDDEEGTEDGPCPFTVHGLTGPEYSKMSMQTLKLKALQHLESQGKTLKIGHDATPQSMYDNPQIYPQMFPWLFPYGLGGLTQEVHKKKISDAEHKKLLLMYYDKRFQTDLYFPIIAFNHEQLKSGTTGSFLLARCRNFNSVASKLQKVNKHVLADLAKRMSEGERVKPVTEDEKLCFSILDSLDHVGGHVKGSLTSKKYMRNEIWSLLSFKGAPSWFITFSPADNKHPICLYYADKEIYFKPELRPSKERDLLVLSNPVAAARFFYFMVQMVIKHVFGVGTDHPGLYGDTSAYYGTVEQQGRLTLHMHMMLWIKGALSPQVIRDRIMNKDLEFQQSLISYLEHAHMGELFTGTLDEVKEKNPLPKTPGPQGIHTILKEENIIDPNYKDPTQTMPIAPPPICNKVHDNENISDPCIECDALNEWWKIFESTVDDLIVWSNTHTCRRKTDPAKNSKKKKKKVKNETAYKAGVKGCLNDNDVCMARFPRDIYSETKVDEQDGHIFMKKLEQWINTFTPTLTYLLRCNTDVGSMLSGTSIKAVISYVTDYVTKPSLKTHQIFSSAYDVFEKNSELLGGNTEEKGAARKLLLKIVNALTSKMEIGSPMACLYLLENPDHYTSHIFVPFWWRTYVSEVRRSWPDPSENLNTDDINPIDSDDSSDTDSVNSDNVTESDDEPGRKLGGGTSECNADVNNLYDELENDQKNRIKIDDNNYKYKVHIEDTPIPDTNVNNDDNDPDKVLLLREQNNYIGQSNVDDYIYRPSCYNVLNLYQWIQTSSKRRKPRKNKNKRKNKSCRDDAAEDSDGESDAGSSDKETDNEWEDVDLENITKHQSFASDHPLYKTHEIICDMNKLDTVVPNILGGALPRSDSGDREFYCMTMLTLFKPWRSGKMLKEENETWDQAFVSYRFNDRDKEIMNNFNLRYECLDARDDYHSALKKKNRKFGLHDSNNVNDTIFDSDSDVSEDDQYNTLADGSYEEVGPVHLKTLRDMQQAESIVRQAGWLKKCSGNLDAINTDPIEVEDMLSSEWTSLVKEARASALKKKQANIPNISESVVANKLRDNVEIVDADYFKYNFKAKKELDNKIVNDVVREFKLNKEQLRAFKIIANHSNCVAPEQLKMYLGGMGGTGKSQVIKALITMFERKNESHWFVVLAPTGTAAALLNGSTYHSMLGVRSRGKKDEDNFEKSMTTLINEARSKLEGVNYIFIDEISMVACHELYAISA